MSEFDVPTEATAPSVGSDVLPAGAAPVTLTVPEPAPEPEPADVPAPSGLRPLQLVKHSWTDPVGDHEAYALVLSVLPATADSPERVSVLWFKAASGPLLASDLEAVTV